MRKDIDHLSPNYLNWGNISCGTPHSEPDWRPSCRVTAAVHTEPVALRCTLVQLQLTCHWAQCTLLYTHKTRLSTSRPPGQQRRTLRTGWQLFKYYLLKLLFEGLSFAFKKRICLILRYNEKYIKELNFLMYNPFIDWYLHFNDESFWPLPAPEAQQLVFIWAACHGVHYCARLMCCYH